MINIQSHQNISKLETIKDLKTIFPNGEANDLNMVMFSTSGVHGTYSTIEELEEAIKTNDEGYEGEYWLTILVIHPRIVSMQYGSIEITLDDIDYLKKLRASSNEFLQNYIPSPDVPNDEVTK